MFEKKKQILTLLTITLFSLGSGVALSQWYWSSQSFTHSVTIGGNIDAKANFSPSTTFASAPLYDDIETVDTLLTVNGGESRYIWVILSPESLVNDVYLRLWVECPTGGDCSALVSTQEYTVAGGSVAPVLISTVAVDGSESVQIERGGDMLWVTGSVWGSSYRFIRVQLDFDNSGLTVGTHDYNVRVEIGDSL